MVDHLQQVEDVLNSFYQTLSGSADEPRDWTALEPLFCEEARISPLPWGTASISLPLGTYINRLRSSLDGRVFYERGLGYRVEVTSCIAEVWSRYEASEVPNWDRPIRSGTNLVQLVLRDGAWKILSMLYEDDAG